MGYQVMTKILLVTCLAQTVTGCMVRPEDMNAWVGMPVEALDTHSLFNTIPMRKTYTASGIEVRNYANGGIVDNCFETGRVKGIGSSASYSGTVNCTTSSVVCNNLFYIKNGVVLEYAPTGRCYTDKTVQPEPRYLMLKNK